ncbi:hypothetical protein, partial [Prosthecobacter sp.]|uniref:hypothetical protein n=1 Tax=Prosthecobacter sp. TaxID=1965333 RepID=UPI0025D328EB
MFEILPLTFPVPQSGNGLVARPFKAGRPCTSHAASRSPRRSATLEPVLGSAVGPCVALRHTFAGKVLRSPIFPALKGRATPRSSRCDFPARFQTR